jgi:hypothetical protein
MKKLLLLAILAPCCVFATAAPVPERVDMADFWTCIYYKDYVMAQWMLNHQRPCTFNDHMYCDLCQLLLAERQQAAKMTSISNHDIDEDVGEYIFDATESQ